MQQLLTDRSRKRLQKSWREDPNTKLKAFLDDNQSPTKLPICTTIIPPANPPAIKPANNAHQVHAIIYAECKDGIQAA